MAHSFSLAGIFPESGNEELGGSHQRSAGEHTFEVIPEREDHDADQEDQA
jgi:hypothetical protein